jgi:2-methylcitrate dehydratase PrpD
VLSLRARHGFAASDVARVDTVVAHGNARNLCYDDPQQEMEARFSMNYCVALALAHGRLTLADFTPEAVRQAELRRLMPLVTMRSSPQTGDERIPHEVTITLRDATVLHTSVQWARGAIEDPFDRHDIDAKFRDCCARWLTAADLDAADRALGSISDLAAIDELMRHLDFDAQASAPSQIVRNG